MVNLGITLVIGTLFGFLFFKLKVPGGMMVGALLAVSVLSVCTDFAYMPSYARVAAQITAGAFIACTVEKSDLKRLPYIIKPAAILLTGMLILNIAMGFLIHGVTDLDWVTAFMCAVPGGMSDTPIIAADMGGNGGKVAVMQFARLLTCIGLFPSLILAVTKQEKIPQREGRGRVTSGGKKIRRNLRLLQWSRVSAAPEKRQASVLLPAFQPLLRWRSHPASGTGRNLPPNWPKFFFVFHP